MSVVLAVLWAASVGIGALSQAPGDEKQWLHDAVRAADEPAVRQALSTGERGLVNTPDQCTTEYPLNPLDRMLNSCFGRAAQSGLLRYFLLEIDRWPNCWSKLGRTSTSAKTSVGMAVAFTMVNNPAKRCCCAVGWTPLHYAADNNMIALSEVLLENGADFKAKTKREHSGRSAACVSHNI